ncbi:hypothetical protein AZF37_06890 [endosymbiont 'TC1' of Trimyema compressum]|uniref:amidohydrolase family protein n=1 Tax=endosymbiont 'TC1' of Trimyema compressum TaxID=243899 RepID=UPI0007F0FF6B|nr:amidohydrolase family protein [endosymbiont 'TC1' of Trimyema compressum]AMP20925.1 hypothetical protein AZF37_06890 [endosymbiont 'TC1' of Trimyema compressum]
MISIEGEIWVNPQKILENGVLLIENGKIIAVGESLVIPSHCRRYLYENGEQILPGFVDPHTHLGLYEEVYSRELLNEGTNLVTPWIEAHYGIRYFDMGFKEALHTGGVTTVGVLPGSSNIISGVGCVVKTGGKNPLMKKHEGLKISLGDNILTCHSQRIQTKMAIGSILNNTFSQVASGVMKEGDAFIAKALKGELKVRVHCHREEDIRIALDLKEEFNLDMVIEHGTEGHYLIDEIKNSNVSFVGGPFFIGRPKVEMANLNRQLLTKLKDHSVEVSFMTDYPSNPPEMLKIALLEVIKHGISPMDAFEMITCSAAQILGVEEQVGSLDVGKDGDVVIHSQSPFEYNSFVKDVFIKGEKIEWTENYY